VPRSGRRVDQRRGKTPLILGRQADDAFVLDGTMGCVWSGVDDELRDAAEVSQDR
jgi:hypothetical protein